MSHRDNISRDWRNDSWQQWFFERDTKLPVGYFDDGKYVDALVLVACGLAALVIVGLWIAGTL